MIKGIERTDIDFEIHTFADVEGFAHLHVPIVDTRLAIVVAARVSIDADGRLREAVGIDPLEPLAQPLMKVAARNEVGTLKVCGVQTGDVRCSKAIRETGLEGCDSGKLPSANRKIFPVIDLAGELFATSEGRS